VDVAADPYLGADVHDQVLTVVHEITVQPAALEPRRESVVRGRPVRDDHVHEVGLLAQ